MDDETAFPVPNFRRAARVRVGRRIYVAAIIAGATFVGGLLYWPLTASHFNTVAELTVQVSPAHRVGAALNAPSAAPDARLQAIIRECLTDESLAAILRGASTSLDPPPGSMGVGGEATEAPGVVPLALSEVRQHLQVGLSRGTDPAERTRWVKVVWSGPREATARRLVDSLSQEIASRLAREVRVESLQIELEERLDLIAKREEIQRQKLSEMLSAARRSLEGHRLTLLALKQQLDGVRDLAPNSSMAIQQQIDSVRQEVLNSDAQLLASLRQQVISHFEVDETDGLVQHLERLIQDRQAVLSQMVESPQIIQSLGGSGRNVRALEASTSLDGSDARVRANPFFTASAQVDQQEERRRRWSEADAILNELDEHSISTHLEQLQSVLVATTEQKIPVLDLATRLKREQPAFRVVQMRTASVDAPIDAAPSRQWALGMSVIALMLGFAFTLQQSPESLGRGVFRPTQLARYLGLDHLGTIRTARQQPNLVDGLVKILGRRIYQGAELFLCLCLIGVIVAMIWDASVVTLLVQDPLEGLCRAFWVLFSR